MQRDVNIGLIKMKKRIVPFIRSEVFCSVAGGAGGAGAAAGGGAGGVCLDNNKGTSSQHCVWDSGLCFCAICLIFNLTIIKWANY